VTTNDQRRHDTAYLNKRLFYYRKVRRLKIANNFRGVLTPKTSPPPSYGLALNTQQCFLIGRTKSLTPKRRNYCVRDNREGNQSAVTRSNEAAGLACVACVVNGHAAAASSWPASPHICIKLWLVTGAAEYLHKVMAAACFL